MHIPASFFRLFVVVIVKCAVLHFFSNIVYSAAGFDIVVIIVVLWYLRIFHCYRMIFHDSHRFTGISRRFDKQHSRINGEIFIIRSKWNRIESNRMIERQNESKLIRKRNTIWIDLTLELLLSIVEKCCWRNWIGNQLWWQPKRMPHSTEFIQNDCISWFCVFVCSLFHVICADRTKNKQNTGKSIFHSNSIIRFNNWH